MTRRRRILLLVLAVLVALLAAAGFSARGWLEHVIEAELARQLGGAAVDLRLALSPFGIRLKRVRIAEPGGTLADPWLTIDRVVPRVRWWPAPAITSVTIERAHARLTVQDDGTLNITELLRARGGARASLPEIEISDASIELRGGAHLREQLGALLDAGYVPRIASLHGLVRTDAGGAVELTITKASVPELFDFALSSGRIDGERIHGTLSVSGIALGDAALQRWLAPAVRGALARHHVAGELQLTASVAGTLTAPQWSGILTLADVGATPEFFPFPVAGVRGSLTLEHGEVHVNVEIPRLQDHGSTAKLTGDVHDVFGRPELAIAFEGHGLAFAPRLRQAFLRPEEKDVIDSLDPGGTFDVNGSITGPLAEHPTLEVRILPRDGAGSYLGEYDADEGRRVGFPYPARHVHAGQVVIKPDDISIEGLRGEAGATGRFEVNGRILGRPPQQVLDIRVHAERFNVDEGLLHAVEVAAGRDTAEVVRSFHPGGVTDVDVHLHRDVGERSLRVRIDFLSTGLSVQYQDFPYPIDDIQGTLRLHGGHIVIGPNPGETETDVRPITAHRDAAMFVVRGRLDPTSSQRVGGSVHVSVVAMPIDQDLRDALGARDEGDIERVFEELRPSAGLVSAEFEMQLDRDGVASRHIEARLEKAVLLPRKFPVRASEVAGALSITRDRDAPLTVSVEDVTGMRAGAPFRVAGAVGTDGQVSFEVDAEAQPIDAELLVALAVLSPDAAALAHQLEPTGSFAATYRFTSTPGRPQVSSVELRPAAVSLKLPILPAPIEELSGLVTITLGASPIQVSIDKARGRFRTGLILVDRAEITPLDGRFGIELYGSASDVPLSQDLGSAVHADVRDIFHDIDPTGKLDISPMAIVLEHDTVQQEIIRLQFDGDLMLHGVSTTFPARLSDMRGRIELKVRHGPKPDPFRVTGAISGLELHVAGQNVTGVSADLLAEPKGIELNHIAGIVAAGVLPPDGNRFFIDLKSPHPFNGRLQFDGLELKQLYSNWSSRDLSGKLAGFAEYSGTFEDFPGAGRRLSQLSTIGKVSVKQGKLWELPFFSTLARFGVLRALGIRQTPVFNEGNVDFRVADGHVYLEDIKLSNPALSLAGKGQLGRSGLMINVTPSVGPQIPLISPLLEPVIDVIRKGALTFQVFGPYANPRIRYSPLSIIDWRGSTPVDQPVLPERKERKLRDRF
ncbi:MAG: hypothetical protein U1E76_12385 [Planctomycetota bacterium]